MLDHEFLAPALLAKPAPTKGHPLLCPCFDFLGRGELGPAPFDAEARARLSSESRSVVCSGAAVVVVVVVVTQSACAKASLSAVRPHGKNPGHAWGLPKQTERAWPLVEDCDP